jgi:hypothetical protein
MADYSFTPQFANLTGLQPLPALDVTRGARLQFQPLQAIQIQSSQPELVGQSIAGAVSNIAKGALSGITAKYEEKKAEEQEKRKYAHETAVAQIKAGEKAAEKQEQRGWEWQKMQEQNRLIKERTRGVLPPSVQFEEGDLPSQDNTELGNAEPLSAMPVDENVNFEEQPQEMPTTGYVSPTEQQQIQFNVEKQIKALSGLSPEYLSASTGAGPIAPSTETPSIGLSGIDVSFVQPQQEKEAAATSAELKKITETKPEAEKPAPVGQPKAVKYFRSQEKANEEYAKTYPGWKTAQLPVLVQTAEGPAFAVKREIISPEEQEAIDLKKQEAKSKIETRKSYEDIKKERLYQQYISAAQKEPSIDTLENPVKGITRFAVEIPELYQQYMDHLRDADIAAQRGDKKTALYHRRMVAENVNAIIDSFTRLASGKAVTEGQINLIKKEALDPSQQITKAFESWSKGGVVAPFEQVRSMAKIAATIGNEAAEKANYFILGQRDKFKEQGVSEKNLPKFYPQDIGFENEAKKTLSNLTDEYEMLSDQYDKIKDSKDSKDQYNIDILRKRLELMDYRISSLTDRINQNAFLEKKKKPKKEFLGHKEFVDRPTGLRDMYGMTPFQQLQQELTEPVSQ